MPKVKKRLTARQADEMLRDIRKEGTLQQYKRSAEEFQMNAARKALERAKNYQLEYANMYEQHARLPHGLQGPAMERMRALGAAMQDMRTLYPRNFPRGFDSTTPMKQDLHRRIS